MSKMSLDRNKNNSGVISIEASVVMFITMVMIVFCIFGMMYVMNCETIRAFMYEKIYTAPLIKSKEYLSKSAKSGDIDDFLLWCEDYGMDAITGTDNISMIGHIDMKGTTYIGCSTEFGLCTDRLRRWQLYDDIAEDTFGE
ncbi:MAG: hypothetical protein IJJ74_00315 [Eubacterium sp.]|nr:hypothetical protein [Eubacterium sp.]